MAILCKNFIVFPVTIIILLIRLWISTSPSVYVNFHSLRATDDCGPRGSQTVVTSTMIAFAPGELSTMATALAAMVMIPGGGTSNYVISLASASPYNFDDLPCPPMAKMVS